MNLKDTSILKNSLVSKPSELIFFLIPPSVLVVIGLLNKRFIGTYKAFGEVYAAFLLNFPNWLIPIIAPLTLLVILLGIPLLIGQFKPRMGRVLFGAMCLSMALITIDFIFILYR